MGDKEDAFYVIFKSGRLMKFIRCTAGLYYYDTENLQDHELTVDFSFVQTTTQNESELSDSAKEKLRLARYYQELFAWPSKEDMIDIVEEKQVKNAAIEASDIKKAHEVLGKATAEIRGKMKRRTPKQHKTRVPGMLPDHLQGREIELYTDVFTTSKCSFLITKAGSKLNHFKAKYLKNKKMSNVAKIIKEEIEQYEARGFKVTALHADNAFDNDQMRTIIGARVLHIYAREEHVGVIERQIRTFKERLRSVIQGLPYKRYPKIMFISMVAHVVEMMNRFVKKGGLSDTMSAAELVDGVDKIDLAQRQILFGSYAEIWDGTTNTMKERSIPCIALNRSNNASGFYFMSLETGKRHNSNQWEELPITDDIILKVESLTKQKAISEVILESLNMDLTVKYRDPDCDNEEDESDTQTTVTEAITDDERSQEDSETNANIVVVEDVHEGDEDDGIEEIPVREGLNIIPDDSSADDSELMVQEEDIVEDLGVDVNDDDISVEMVNHNMENLNMNNADDNDMDLIIDNDENVDDELIIDDSTVDSSIKEDENTSTPMEIDTETNNKRTSDNNEPELRRSKRQNTQKKPTFEQQYDQIYGAPQLKPTKTQESVYGHTFYQNKYGYDTIKSKYTQACTFLQNKIQKEKENYIMDN